VSEIREALEKVAALQGEARKLIENNGFVFTDIGTERGNWQHLAFTLYCEICEIDTVARNALGWPLVPDGIEEIRA
jgi:hypothetical protein